MEHSAWARGAFLVLLMLFVLICGIHLAGVHHDSDLDGLGSAGGLGAIVVIGALALSLSAVGGRWILPYSGFRPPLERVFAKAPLERWSTSTVVPLRC